jgi:hypothetical protein
VTVLRQVRVQHRGAIALAAVVLLGAVAVLVSPSVLAGPVASGTPGPCPAPLAATQYTGSTVVLGGPPGGVSVADLTIQLGGAMEKVVTNVSTGYVVSATCANVTSDASTNATGAFSASVSPPSETCTSGPDGSLLCTTWSGPYGPLALAVASLLPPAYGSATAQHGTQLTVDLVAVLASLRLDPSGPVATGAPGAGLTITASAQTANGNATPTGTPVDYAWNLTGTGWSFTATPAGASATVVAAPGAPVGYLSVVGSATLGETLLTTPPVGIDVLAAATIVDATAVNRTLLDVGGSVLASARASGAAGFDYVGYFSNGTGPPVTGPCASVPGLPGLVNVSCTGVLILPTVGTFAPEVNVTNGYSSATVELPPITVTAPPILAIDPAKPIGYAGAATDVGVEAAPGFGAPPFAGACLSTGSGVDLCSATAGPNWTFAPVYAAAGVYPARAWAIDADGLNRSTNATVTVVAPLALAPVNAPGNASVGTTVSVGSGIAGGDLPIAYFVNASSAGIPLAAGLATEDGPIAATFQANATGIVRITVTAIDALGTRLSTSAAIEIGPALVAAVRSPGGGPTGPVEVGSPFPVDWEAFSVGGSPVPTYAAAVDVTLAGPGGPIAGWVNASGIGAFPAVAAGEFAVPLQAWVDGTLNLSITPGVAGPATVGLAGAGLPGPVAPLTISVVPDLTELKLTDPTVALAGLRSNATEYRVEDRFGDPVPGAELVVEVATPSGAVDQLAPVLETGDGATYAWVNFTVGSLGGTVRVLDRSGDLLLPARDVPALGAASTPASPPLLPLGVSIPIGLLGASVAYFVARRRPRPATARPIEEELKRLADGCAQIVAIVGDAGSSSRPAIAAAWQPPPAPPELDEWIASLLTDGTLRSVPRADGVLEFCLGAPPEDPVRITLDADELARAIERRDQETAETPPDP